MVTIYETVIVKVTGFGFKARGLKVWSFEASGPICFTSPEREEYSVWGYVGPDPCVQAARGHSIWKSSCRWVGVILRL